MQMCPCSGAKYILSSFTGELCKSRQLQMNNSYAFQKCSVQQLKQARALNIQKSLLGRQQKIKWFPRFPFYYNDEKYIFVE